MGRVFVFCEYSDVVGSAFRAEGHDVTSCDLLPSEGSPNHYQGDGRHLLQEPWDLVIAHPPCSYLCHYGWAFKKNRNHNPRWWRNFQEATAMFTECLSANAPLIAVENPPQMNAMARRIFGPPSFKTNFAHWHGQGKKGVGFWLSGLPPLIGQYENPNAASVVVDWRGRQHDMSSVKRRLERARFDAGLAAAMAKQWGCFLPR